MNKASNIWLIAAGICITMCFSCDNYSISERQAESFLKYYPLSTADNAGKDVIQTLDGGYLILSNYSSNGTPGSDRDIMLIRCDEFGRQNTNSLWLVGSNGIDRGNSLIQIEGGYIVAGSSDFYGRTEGLLVKVGTNGEQEWFYNYGGYQEMEFNQVIQSIDGNYLTTGYIQDSVGEQKVILYKIASDGNIQWMMDPQGYTGFNDVGASVLQLQPQGRILVVGTHSPVGSAGTDRILILNSNNDGRILYSLQIPVVPGDQNLIGLKIIRNQSGQVIILGNEVNEVNEFSRVFLTQIELTGGGYERIEIRDSAYLENLESTFIYDIKPVSGSVLALAGYTEVQNDYNIFFGKVNENFQFIEHREFGSKGFQSAYGLCVTGDDGYAITGSIDLGGGRTSMLLKLDLNAELN